MALLFDIEANGLLDTVSVVHCIHAYDTETGEWFRWDKEEVKEGVGHLMAHPFLVGHNILKYDLPALRHVFGVEYKGKIRDTLLLGKLAWLDIWEIDRKLAAQGKLPSKLMGRYSLKAFGYRLGVLKGEYGNDEEKAWAEWSQEMSDYCRQDVAVTRALYEKVLSKGIPEEAIELEHDFARIIQRQYENGVHFNVRKAADLYATLSKRRAELTVQLQEVFPPFFVQAKRFTPKSNNKRFGYFAGCELTQIKQVEFNPSSRDHIALMLKRRYGWAPTEYTDNGKPKVDDAVLSKLIYPEANLLCEYLMIQKRIGMLAEGDNAWLKLVTPERLIHGGVDTLGAVSRRCTHAKPNLAQVPAVGAPYGEECRELFEPRPGWVLVGADASGLELRDLAHYIARYDNGAYGEIILTGDIHTANQNAAGLSKRSQAKRFIYAYLYGAGNLLLGEIATEGDGKGYTEPRLVKIGKALREKFLANMPALGSLVEAVQAAVQTSGGLKGLDGAFMPSRSAHSALNLLLQSAGAIVMKKALVLMDAKLRSLCYVPGIDYEYVLNVHDEIQTECRPEIAEIVGQTAVESIRKAGEYFKFRCPLDGEYKMGKNWKETH